MKKKVLRFISTALAVVMMISIIPTEFADAALSYVDSPAKVKSFVSTEHFEKEVLKAEVTDRNTLKIDFQTPLVSTLFRLSLYRIGENKGDLNLNIFVEPELRTASDGTTLYGFVHSMDMKELEIPDGNYNFYLRRCATEEEADRLLYGRHGLLCKSMEISVRNGVVNILRYDDVIEYSRKVKDTGKDFDLNYYLDNTLSDFNFVLRDPATRVYAEMTQSKIDYIKSVSDRITAGIYSNYEKLVKIYEYTAENFFYDSIALQNHALQYCDPYLNIYNFEHGLSSVNSKNGRVYTTCQGYAAIFISLARAQGIPARIVNGHRLTLPSNNWFTEEKIDNMDHWWAEAYCNGRWFPVDANAGTANKYNKNTGKWTETGLMTYAGFDPSDELVAMGQVTMNLYPDFRRGKFTTNQYQIEKLRNFFNNETIDRNSPYEAATTNGKLISSNYDPYDIETWRPRYLTQFMTDGKGNVGTLKLSDYGLGGKLDLSGFTTLKLLSSHDNNLTEADISGCTSLEKLYLQENDITKMDLTNDRKLWYIRARNNPMKELTLYINGRNRSFIAEDHGTFSFTIDNRCKNQEFSLYSAPDVGYKLEGVYSKATGNHLSTKSTWHFTPKAVTHLIRFEPDPDSYVCTLTEGDSQQFKVKYIQAAAKRLAELGYYMPYDIETAGTETSFTAELAEAASKFQTVCGLPSNDGTIDEETWSVLFSSNALPMVPEYDYPQVLAHYLEVKAAREKAAEELETISITARSSAKKGEINVSWQTSTADGEEITDITGYEVYRASKRAGEYKKIQTSPKMSCRNTRNLKKGRYYYYKVRAYIEIEGQKLYSDWSSIACRKAI